MNFISGVPLDQPQAMINTFLFLAQNTVLEPLEDDLKLVFQPHT
jgi:hypothetical protein